MKNLAQALQQSGFHIAHQPLQIKNFSFESIIPNKAINKDYLSSSAIPTSEFSTMSLRPWESNHQIQPKTTLFYFWSPDCDNCLPGLKSLDNLAGSKKIPENVTAISVVSETGDMTILQSLKTQGINHLPTIVDLHGGFAEQLGILATPGSVLVDPSGTIIAWANDPISFDEPSFDLTLSLLAKTREIHLFNLVQAEPEETQQLKTILGIPMHGLPMIPLVILLCCFLIRLLVHQRKRCIVHKKYSC